MIPCESRFESNTGVSQGCERCRIYKSSTENTGFGSWCLRSSGRTCRRPIPGKANLTRALGTRNEREANRLAVPWIADFQAAIIRAASITENPHGYDWITRYRAYRRGQNRFLPETRLFSPHSALALPATQTKPVPVDRIILLWAKQTKGQPGHGGKVWPVRRMARPR